MIYFHSGIFPATSSWHPSHHTAIHPMHLFFLREGAESFQNPTSPLSFPCHILLAFYVFQRIFCLFDSFAPHSSSYAVLNLLFSLNVPWFTLLCPLRENESLPCFCLTLWSIADSLFCLTLDCWYRFLTPWSSHANQISPSPLPRFVYPFHLFLILSPQGKSICWTFLAQNGDTSPLARSMFLDSTRFQLSIPKSSYSGWHLVPASLQPPSYTSRVIPVSASANPWLSSTFPTHILYLSLFSQTQSGSSPPSIPQLSSLSLQPAVPCPF